MSIITTAELDILYISHRLNNTKMVTRGLHYTTFCTHLHRTENIAMTTTKLYACPLLLVDTFFAFQKMHALGIKLCHQCRYHLSAVHKSTTNIRFKSPRYFSSLLCSLLHGRRRSQKCPRLSAWWYVSTRIQHRNFLFRPPDGKP